MIVKNIEEQIIETKKYCPDANEQVLKFIFNFAWHTAINAEQYEVVRTQFMTGYCYYFAVMLQTAFERGNVCWAAPYGHMVWVDDNNVPYDIEGVSATDAEYFIPISYLNDGINDFKRIPGVAFNASKEFVEDIIKNYKIDMEKPLN